MRTLRGEEEVETDWCNRGCGSNESSAEWEKLEEKVRRRGVVKGNVATWSPSREAKAEH